MTIDLPWIPARAPVDLICMSQQINDERDLVELIEVMKANPSRRLAWSRHVSRGAARQRINVLKKSARFRGRPQLRFETRTERPNEPGAGVYIVVSWDPTVDPASTGEPTELEIAQARKFGMHPDELAANSVVLWGKSLDDKVEELTGSSPSPQKRGAVTRKLMNDMTSIFGQIIQE